MRRTKGEEDLGFRVSGYVYISIYIYIYIYIYMLPLPILCTATTVMYPAATSQ